MPFDCQLLLFSRFPTPGEAKTRLIPALGSKGAARLQQYMTEHAVLCARFFLDDYKDCKNCQAGVTLYYTGAPLRTFRLWLGGDLHYCQQPAGNLGSKMSHAFKTTLEKGHHTKAIVFGTDIPEINTKTISKANIALDTHDIVIGPASDGGYYLIGMKSFIPKLFINIDWGTERVFNQTMQRIVALGLTVAKLPLLNDVDRPEDLQALQNNSSLADFVATRPLLSIIIPTLNEAKILERTLSFLKKAKRVEIIVVDGGSTDETFDIATRAGAIVHTVNTGRAAQLNTGAQKSKGRFLLFLHADTQVPPGYDDSIRATLDTPTTVAGAFRFTTDAPGWQMRLVEMGTHFRSTVLQMPYGDQGLFLKKRIFDEQGGFANLPIMEDFEMVRRLRKRGPVVTLSEAVVTSARRWQNLGILRTTITNQIMIAGFLLGIQIQTLAGLYRRLGKKIK